MTDAEILEVTVLACRNAGCTCTPHVVITHVYSADDAGDGDAVVRLTATAIEHEKSKCEGYRRFVGAMGAN